MVRRELVCIGGRDNVILLDEALVSSTSQPRGFSLKEKSGHGGDVELSCV